MYEGELGDDFSSHRIKTCSTGGSFQTTITPQVGATPNYLVVPSSTNREGSYGDGLRVGNQRPAATVPCEVQEIGGCP